MGERAETFLAAAGWGEAARAPLAGDASGRCFLRLTQAGTGAGTAARAVLMIAPPGPDARTDVFLALAGQLCAAGLSAPRPIAAEAEAGLVLMEDLGDAVVARIVAAEPACEAELYGAAVAAMLALQRVPVPDYVPRPDAAALAAATDPAAEWYAAPAGAPADLAARLADSLAGPLATLMTETPAVLAHRDYHAENLLWLPEREGAARIGLVDFQDAFGAPAAYDLVSLLEDARRDLGPGIRAAALAQAAAGLGLPVPVLERHCAVLGAQRNLRILGVFARLARRDGRSRYLALLPRVWGHLQGDLAHPALADTARLVAAHLPPPDRAHLSRLEAA